VRKLEAPGDGLPVFGHGQPVVSVARGYDAQVAMRLGRLGRALIQGNELFVVGLGEAGVADAQEPLALVQEHLGGFRRGGGYRL
jgi:hypothetical protein